MSNEVPAEYLAEPDRYFMEWIPARLAPKDHAHLGKKSAIAQFALSGDDGGNWYIELGKGAVVPHAGLHKRPSFTLSMSVDTWRALNRQELNGTRPPQ